METIEYKGYTITIEQEQDANNPYKEFDQLTDVVTWMSHYEFSSNGAYISQATDDPYHRKHKRYSSPEEIKAALESGALVYAAPLYAHIHSGITVNLGEMHLFWPDKEWDAGLAGYVYVTREKAKAEFPAMFNKAGQRKSGYKLAKMCEERAKCEVEVLDQWLTGDVWVYDIARPDGQPVDSCGWMYGYEYCLQSAKEVIDELSRLELAS